MTKHTEISSLGEFSLIDRLTSHFAPTLPTTVAGCGDDAAVIDCGDKNRYTLLSTDMMLEGIDFDLTYFPLKHLGYKSVVKGISDIIAMNGTPRQITVSVGVSARFSVENLDELYAGIRRACDDYALDLVGGDTSASLTGMVISVTVLGSVDRKRLCRRNGAKPNDLICITGDLGSAYMGLQLLEREKRVFKGNDNPQPQFEGHEYILRRQLSPEARTDVTDALENAGIIPTSMIDISDGLASDLLQICKSSACGARIHLDRLPIAKETHAMADELNADPVVAALNGGEDYELLFTVPLDIREQIAQVGGIDVIGYITTPDKGACLVTPDGSEIKIKAQGFPEKEEGICTAAN